MTWALDSGGVTAPPRDNMQLPAPVVLWLSVSAFVAVGLILSVRGSWNTLALADLRAASRSPAGGMVHS
ncbi:hypothetical protein CcI49_13335 [Frankia sp. CcI49]|nr:hypothetical protein CcI49_13335 [Frankia sp. CcI49]